MKTSNQIVIALVVLASLSFFIGLRIGFGSSAGGMLIIAGIVMVLVLTAMVAWKNPKRDYVHVVMHDERR